MDDIVFDVVNELDEIDEVVGTTQPEFLTKHVAPATRHAHAVAGDVDNGVDPTVLQPAPYVRSAQVQDAVRRATQSIGLESWAHEHIAPPGSLNHQL